MLTSKRWGSALLALATAGTLSLAACGDNDPVDVVPLSIAIDPPTGSVHAGSSEEVTFTVIATLSNGTTEEVTTGVTWASEDADAVTIGQDGVASATTGFVVPQGEESVQVTITATVGELDPASAVVTVFPSSVLTGIDVTPAVPEVPAGLTIDFTATGTYEDGRTADLTGSVTWASSDTDVATVDAGGTATGVEAGETDISAELDGVSGSTTLTVTEGEPVALVVEPPVASVPNGTDQQYTATLELTDGSFVDVTDDAT
jgi:hypothetical protein